MSLTLRSRLIRQLRALAWIGLSACHVYDEALSPQPDAQLDACVPQLEICNGRDDDCDGVTDERDAVQPYCESRIVHANTVCQSGFCVRISCLPDYYTCDGLNENGCESPCPCNRPCPEASDGGLQSGADASL